MTPAAYRRRFRNKSGSSRAQVSATPSVWPAGASDINRQISALHDKPLLSQNYFC
jgi:hypothetical protein